MKKLYFSLVFICISLVSLAQPLRVACVGDSITFGATIENRENNSYPAQLAVMLGEDYVVENFGVSGSTLLFDTNRPYVKTPLYNKVFEFKPDVIFICLGTNDSKGDYRELMPNFESDYKKLIESFKAKLPNVEIVLMTPTKSHNEVGRMKIDPAYLTKTIVKAVQKVAFDTKLEVIDMHPLFGEWKDKLMPDKVHPSASGATLMALRIREFLKTKDKYSIDYCFDKELKNPTNFYGYDAYAFKFEGKTSRVVMPRKIAEGKPWVWRARFWDLGLTDIDIALLERGYHIVYNDVTHMFGSPKAVEQWEKFYDYVTSKGLNKKCVIECISRGGLIAYNYAAKRPETVSAILADAPVMDFKSWPMGAGNGKAMTEKLFAAYGFSSEQEAREYVGNPVDNAEILAKSGIKMIHVCGTADKTVPVADNTLKFKQKLQTYDSTLTYYPKAGVDHHPHGYDYTYPRGLEYPQPLVARLLRCNDANEADATVPIKGFRERGKFAWDDIAKEISDSTATQKYDILLLGNSITHGFGSGRTMVSHRNGKVHMDAAFPNKSWFSAGISADRTQHLLYRILTGGYEKCDPKYVVITIGINNLNHDRSTVDETIDGILACVDAVREKMPNSKIVLFGTLPAQKHIASCKQIAQRLKKHKFDKKVTYVDTFPLFAPDGENVVAEYYGKDKLHPNAAGYKVWTNLMTKYIKK